MDVNWDNGRRLSGGIFCLLYDQLHPEEQECQTADSAKCQNISAGDAGKHL